MLAAEASRPCEEIVSNMQKEIDRINKLQQLLTHALNSAETDRGDVSHLIITHLENSSRGYENDPLVYDLALFLPNYVTLAVLDRNCSGNYQSAIECFTGFPFIAETGDDYPALTVSEHFHCTMDPQAKVLDIKPQDDGTVMVAYSTQQRSTTIAIFSMDGCKLKEVEVHTNDHVKIVSMVTKRVAADSNHHRKLVDLSIPEKRTVMMIGAQSSQGSKPCQKGVYILSESDNPAAYTVCDVRPCLFAPGTSPQLLFDVNVQNPITIVADSHETHFAIIEECEVGPFISSGTVKHVIKHKIEIFRRKCPNVIATYPTEKDKKFSPSDICFFFIGGSEMLLVADKATDCIHVVNHRNGCKLVSYLGKWSHRITMPTVLSPDELGRLWIGCRGGRILTCFSREELPLYETLIPPSTQKINQDAESIKENRENSCSVTSTCDLQTSSKHEEIYELCMPSNLSKV